MFDLDAFIADLRSTLGERSRQAMKQVVARAVSDPSSVMRAIGEPDSAGLKVLYQSPELTVLNVVWAPKFVTVPHDHRMTAVIGMYSGRGGQSVLAPHAGRAEVLHRGGGWPGPGPR